MTSKQFLKIIKSDFRVHGGKSFLGFIKIYFFDAKFRLLLNYRIGNYLNNSGSKNLGILIPYYKYKQITKRGCQISFKAKLGSVTFKHPLGVVIGDNVIVGNNVKIWQQVTIGSHGRLDEAVSYPIIQDNVRIYAGAKIFGGIVIGEGATIAANAVVNTNVAKGDTVAGVPAKSIKNKTM